ncbi:diacylglycerol/lipid kinase family protein [Candidatus Poriferisodalis sp.]|uniref:diacylglycerol/lipid kinase family protein n=1 Tax=Candidatus Poriferisodalis sp. TaxID=3101277 RepID=UPI003B518D12
MRVLLLVNDSASSTTARTRVLIHTVLSERHDTEVAFTNRRGHAARLARGAATTGTDAVVVLGGDGTLNEAANGVAGTDCVLAALPGGSTNVFARTIGTPDDPLVATEAVLDALEAGSITSAGLGRTSGRFFLFHCGMGLDAAIVERVERHPTLKRYLGHPLFLLAGVDTLLRHYDRRTGTLSARIAGPESTQVDGCFLIVVANTDPYTFLGSRPVHIAPAATLHNGLSVVGLRSLRLADSLNVISAVFGANGSLGDIDPSVVQRIDHVRELTVTGIRPFGHQLDGDHLGAVDELRIEWVPDVLRLVMPSSTA